MKKILKQACKKVYYKIPDYYRMGKDFREKYELINKVQWNNKQQLEEYQLSELKKIVQYSYEYVPYYKNLFDSLNIKPDDIKSFNDMKKIPYLTKDIIRENLNDLISTEFKNKEKKLVTTGGSTDIPLEFYIDFKKDKINEWAFVANMWSRIGYDIKKAQKSVMIKGYKPNKGILGYDGINMVLSSYLISNENVNEYVEAITKHNPDFIQAYPSSISLLCKYIKQNNIKVNLPKLKAIICPSEMLYNSQREAIEEVFKVRVYTFYGHTEHCCIGGECEKSSFYHLNSEYGFTELLDENDKDIVEEDRIGELVVTGFHNLVMPFIRYKTRDMAINTNMKCECGRDYKLIKKLYGRAQEYFVKSNGERVPFISSDKPLRGIKDKIINYQYVQNSKEKIVLNIQPLKELTKEDLNLVKKELKVNYNELKININIVNSIERTKRGKFKFLIQNIKA